MKNTYELKRYIENYMPVIYIAKCITGAFIMFSLAFILLKFPEDSAQGIKNGINLCMDVLIPTLYPFMILSNILINSGFINKKIPILTKITDIIFRLPGESTSVILFSMIGGLPVGAKMTQNLYLKGAITREQGERMLFFCMNPGPAFVISSVGYYMLGSKEMGILIYISLVLSSLTLGFLTRFIAGKSEQVETLALNQHIRGVTIHASITDASKSILSVCSWVVAFSCISQLIECIVISDTARMFLNCITEMTNGCKIASKNFSVPVLAGVIGFSGFCAHFQVMDAILALKVKYKYFLVARIVNGSFSVVYCSLLSKLFPIASETFSAGVKPDNNGISVSFFTSLLMILMAVLFIIGDDYLVTKKKKI